MINKINLVVGVDKRFQNSYLVTSLYQNGIHYSYIDDVESSVKNGIRVFIWGTSFDFKNIKEQIIVITDSFFFKDLFKLKKFTLHQANYFCINKFSQKELNGFLLLQRDIISFNTSENYGYSLDVDGEVIDNSGISIEKRNNIKFIIFPFKILNEVIGEKSDYRHFYSYSTNDFYVEFGPTIDYHLLRKLCLNILIYAFNDLKLPLLSIKHEVHKKSCYSIRIDSDGYNYDSLVKTLDLAISTNKKFNWFIDLYSWGKYGGLDYIHRLKATNQNIQLHSFRHMTYKNFSNNFLNVFTGKYILKRFKLTNNAMVGPFGFYNKKFQKVLDCNQYLYSSEFGFNVNDMASFPDNDFKKPIQIPTNNASITTLDMSLFNEKQIFKHLYESTIKLSNENGLCILYEHPLYGIDRYESEYKKLIDSLDRQLEYIDIEDYINSLKTYFTQCLVHEKINLNNINLDEYYYYNKFNGSIQIDNCIQKDFEEEFYIPYDKAYLKKEILNERRSFYYKNFKSEYESSFPIFFIKYYLRSLLIIIISILKVKLKKLVKYS